MDAKLWEDRKKALTASDMVVLRQESPWGSEEEIWLTKQGQIEQGPTGLACASGIVLEPMIRDLWSDHNGVVANSYRDWDWLTGEPTQRMYLDDINHLGATPDGILWFKDQIWGQEIKSTSEDWSVLPDRVITQCVVGMICTGISRWKVITYHLAKGEATQIVINKAIYAPIEMDLAKMKEWDLFLDDYRDLAEDCQHRARDWWDLHMIQGFRPEPPPPKIKKLTKKQLADLAKEEANAGQEPEA
jgi:hypothetical protein